MSMVTFDSVGDSRTFSQNVKDKATFLPEPPTATRKLTIISCDDHVVEPPDMFEGRLPAEFVERAPRVFDGPRRGQVWMYDGHEIPTSA